MKEQDIGTIIWDSAATTVVTHFSSTYTTSKYMRTSIYRYIYIYSYNVYIGFTSTGHGISGCPKPG